jgi:hypothetical protein
VARYLGGNVALSNLLGATIGSVTPLCCAGCLEAVSASGDPLTA